MTPLVSLIVPVLNSEKYLEACFESIVKQTYKNFEVILVVGKSSDNSEIICQKWTEEDSRFRIVPQEINCLGYARNRGIRASKGEYIAFCDSDDCLREDFLEVFIKTALENDSDVVESQFMLCSENLEPIDIYDRINYGDALSHDFLEIASATSVWKYFYKKSFFTDNEFVYPEVLFGEDLGIYSLIFSCTNKVSYIKAPLYYYRQVPKSLSNDPNKKRLRYESLFQVIDYIHDEFSKRNLLEKNWLKLLFQIENHSSSVIQEASSSIEEALEMQSSISSYLKKQFNTTKTIFDVSCCGWGSSIAHNICGRINTINGNSLNTCVDHYFFEFLSDTPPELDLSTDFVLFDLVSEGRYLATYKGDLGVYVRNWKLGYEKFLSMVKKANNDVVIILMENYLADNPSTNDILSMLYSDIKENHTEIDVIGPVPDAIQSDETLDLATIYQFKQFMDQVHILGHQKANYVEVKGGLGNQLYQYAFSKYIEKKTGNSSVLHTGFFNYVSSSKGSTKRIYSLGNFDISPMTVSGRLFCSRAFYEDQNEIEITKDVENAFYSGYWQNISFFNEVEDLLLKELQVKKELLSRDVTDLAKEMDDTSVSMHIRRGDYLNASNINLFEELTISYYQSAVNYITSKAGSVTLYIFSDDPDYALSIKDVFGINTQVMPVRKDYEDFYLMSQTRHHIIANSTFSLWAALLSPNRDGITIAPRNWFKNQEAQNLYKGNWVIL